MELPSNWKAGNFLDEKAIYGNPPSSSDPARIILIGMLESDPGHRLYEIPTQTTVADVVRVFRVGAHGAESYNYDVSATVALVADKATKIAEIIPYRVFFADIAGLKLRFERQITPAELKLIEALFSEQEVMQAGLERYLSAWDGSSPLLAPVLKENLLHFWWD